MDSVLSVFLDTSLFYIAFEGQQNAFPGPVQICQICPVWDFQGLSLGRWLNAHGWGIPSSLGKRQLKKKQLNIYNLNPKSLLYLESSEFSMHIALKKN